MTEKIEDKYEFIKKDKRVITRNLRRHELSPAEHQKHLKGLADDADFGCEQIVYKEDEKISS